MITDHDLAGRIVDLMKSIGEQLHQSLIEIKGKVSEPEYLAYRHGIACILTEILTEVENPINDLHPDLGSYDES